MSAALGQLINGQGEGLLIPTPVAPWWAWRWVLSVSYVAETLHHLWRYTVLYPSFLCEAAETQGSYEVHQGCVSTEWLTLAAWLRIAELSLWAVLCPRCQTLHRELQGPVHLLWHGQWLCSKEFPSCCLYFSCLNPALRDCSNPPHVEAHMRLEMVYQPSLFLLEWFHHLTAQNSSTKCKC